MRVLLINPFYPISETPSPPLGLAYLAAALSEAGIEVKILDLVVFPHSQAMLQNVLEQFKPQIAGLTAVTMTFDFAIGVIRDIKHLCPKILTVMGGPHVSFCAPETLQRFPELDIVVLGEGEQTVVELIRAVENGRQLEGVKGIAYRSSFDIRCTPERAPIEDLDTLPVPARHLLPLGRYRALGMPVSLTTSRGCPYKCIFCVGRKMVGARVRYRSPHKVVDELEYLHTLRFHQINIADDLFTANKNHCLAVCDEIVKRRLKITWTSFARVDTVSEEVLTRMKAAGCSAVSFGIESGNPQILKTIKKGITREQVVAAVIMCRRAGITPFASFILGLPGETPQTIQETLDFGEQLKDLGLSFGFHLLAPFPGTEIRANSHQYGIKILTDDWSQYHANRAIVETAWVDRQMLDNIVISWESEYNQLLADIKQRMQTAEASPQEAGQLINLERIVLVYDLMMKNAIEQKGFWCKDGRSMRTEDNLRTLSDRIGSVVDADPQLLRDTLSHALQQGNLKYTDTNGEIRWQWVDYL
ncbi:MAG: radical SAM protein [Desulfobacterales bacterium]|nr:MAG: radical SAM protein [Desulfobacterales bacterium]